MRPIGTLARRDPAPAELHQPSLSGVNDRKGTERRIIDYGVRLRSAQEAFDAVF